MADINLFNSATPPSYLQQKAILDFLFEHLEQYGDPREDIEKAMEYSTSQYPGQGGLILTAEDDEGILGAVVINKTGMSGYIPENILVYIAVHKRARGKGVGKQLMEESIKMTTGDIALHVEPDNPAVHLYKKVGFTNKYLEMRYKK